MSEKREQPLYFPAAMIEEIRHEANRLDRSLSWCVQFAWMAARKELTRLEPMAAHPTAKAIFDRRYAGQPKAKQTLFFPCEMLQELKGEAERLDRSISWVVQCAWCLALEAISARPSAVAF